MAKKVTARSDQPESAKFTVVSDDHKQPGDHGLREHGLVGDVVFEPPLTPEERRRRGVDVTAEERWEQIRRRLAEAEDRS
jgi:hypothetical protein